MNVMYDEGGVTSPEGFLAFGVHCGVKKYKKDLAVVFSKEPALAAGVFTTNKVKAAPVLYDMDALKGESAQAIVVNSGNANACTGEQGIKDASEMASLTAGRLGIDSKKVLVLSTGVIGINMPMDLIRKGITECCAGLSVEGGDDAASAILTTDTFKKKISVKIDINGRTVTIGGMAKGSGMIHPNMATMLCSLTTDAVITHEALLKALRDVTKKSFNMISVDGDTSTNDTALILANGMAKNKLIDIGTVEYDLFLKGLETAAIELAKMMAKDGEGATKFMEVNVVGAASKSDAVMTARSIVRSNLVKTAVFGEDANWGRIMCAAGYAGAALNPDTVDIYIESLKGRLKLAEDGMTTNFPEDIAKQILKEKDIKITVDLKLGDGSASAWGCDFSYDYVKINGSYRS